MSIRRLMKHSFLLGRHEAATRGSGVAFTITKLAVRHGSVPVSLWCRVHYSGERNRAVGLLFIHFLAWPGGSRATCNHRYQRQETSACITAQHRRGQVELPALSVPMSRTDREVTDASVSMSPDRVPCGNMDGCRDWRECESRGNCIL